MKQTRKQRKQEGLEHLYRRHCVYCGRYRFMDKMAFKEVQAWSSEWGWHWKKDYMCLEQNICKIIAKKNAQAIRKKFNV